MLAQSEPRPPLSHARPNDRERRLALLTETLKDELVARGVCYRGDLEDKHWQVRSAADRLLEKIERGRV